MLRQRMSSINRPVFNGTKVNAMEQTLQLTNSIRKTKHSLVWGLVNVLILGIITFDLSYKCPIYTTWFNYFEYVVVFILTMNIIYHICCYFYFTFKSEQIILKPNLKATNLATENDPYCKLTKDSPTSGLNSSIMKTPNSTLNITPMNMSASSWLSGSPNESQNFSLSSPSWVYYRGSPDNQRRTTTPTKSSYIDTSGTEFINSEHSLQQYLQNYENYEKAMNASNPTELTSNLLSSFWSHPATQSPNELSPFLRKNQYQLSSQLPSSMSNSPSGKSDDSNVGLNVSTTGIEIWKKLQIEPQKLTQWNANLRMWISQTILERLIEEIEVINNEFQKYHLNDVRIGCVGLERLRRTAQSLSVIQQIPTLSAMLPFLELTPNQEYLVKRIHELARGGCMSEFKWNGGGNIDGKDWDESLVTDSAIIIHLLSTYLDSQLLPLPNQPDAKPFSKQHLLRPNEKVAISPVTLAIQQVTEKPPHFRLIVGEEVIEVSKGHNNLFQTILLFLYYVNKKEHGMLGKVNMGRSGVNMLWIIQQ